MKYACLLLPTLFFSFAVRAQIQTPYNPNGDYHTWSLKGHAYYWTLGNSGGISYLAGIEYGFLKNQSIGIDGLIYQQTDSHDDAYDTTGKATNNSDNWQSWEKAVLLNYRYYFNLRRLREEDGLVLYALAFVRYGTIDRHWNPFYELGQNNQYSDDEVHRSAGLMLGTTFVDPDWPWIGIDINTGMFDKSKDISIVNNYGDTPVNTQHTGLGFRMAINMTYAFYRHRRPSGRSHAAVAGL